MYFPDSEYHVQGARMKQSKPKAELVQSHRRNAESATRTAVSLVGPQSYYCSANKQLSITGNLPLSA
jgi:hypothetical protein